MAKNSIREQILAYHAKTLIGKVKSIKTVVRVMPSYSELKQFAVTQFPLAGIVGGVPVPTEKISSRDGSAVDLVISELRIDNYVYVQDNVEPDTTLSNIMDDVWVKCYSDVTYNDLALSTILKPEVDIGRYDPFFAFKITSVVKYKHSTGGI